MWICQIAKAPTRVNDPTIVEKQRPRRRPIRNWARRKIAPSRRRLGRGRLISVAPVTYASIGGTRESLSRPVGPPPAVTGIKVLVNSHCGARCGDMVTDEEHGTTGCPSDS